jgi:hypothetical protein
VAAELGNQRVGRGGGSSSRRRLEGSREGGGAADNRVCERAREEAEWGVGTEAACRVMCVAYQALLMRDIRLG